MNRVLGKMAQVIPGGTRLRPFLHQVRGVQISGRIFIGDDVYIENEYPECVVIEEGAQIGLRSTIIAHTRGAGRVRIRKNAFIGAGALIIAPVGSDLTIGEGAVVGAGSVITADVPPGTLVAPERAKPCALVTVPLTLETSYRDFTKGLRPVQSGPPKTAGGSNAQSAKRNL